MAKSLILPGGSSFTIEEGQGDDIGAIDAFGEKRANELAALMQAEITDPEEFAREVRSNVDRSLAPFLSGSGENLGAEAVLERRARGAIRSGLQKHMQDEFAKEEAAKHGNGQIGELFGPDGELLEGW